MKTKLLKSVTLVLLQFILIKTILAQTSPFKQWDKTFGGDSTDYLTSIQQTFDGGYIMGGQCNSSVSGDVTKVSRGGYDYWIVKTDANGNKQWDKRFGGTSDDDFFSLQQTKDSGYILGGWSSSGIGGDKTENNRGSSDYWIVKINANGVKQWDKTFGGTDYDALTFIQQTKDSGYIMGGQCYSGAGGDKTENSRGSSDYWIVKTNSKGVKQWDKTFGGTSTDLFYCIKQIADTGYILAGFSNSGISGDKTQASRGGYDYWIIKTDNAGKKQWDKTLGGNSNDRLRSLQQTTDGGYILAGYSSSGISGDKSQNSQGLDDYWLVKTDISGNKQWDKTFGGNSSDFCYAAEQTIDGGYIIGGWSLSGISGNKTEASNGNEDYWIVKTDTNGNQQWDESFGGTGTDWFTSPIHQTTDGGYILGGYSNSNISGDKTQNNYGGTNDYWIVKLAFNCTQLHAKITPQGDLDICIAGSVVLKENGGTGLIYQWLKGNNNIKGATHRSYTAKNVGSYKVVVTNSNGCRDTSKAVKVTNSCSAVASNSNIPDIKALEKLSLYPNPSSGNITVKYNSTISGKITLNVYDLITNKILTHTSEAVKGVNTYNLNLTNFSAGAYYLELINNNEKNRTRFIIRK